MDRSRRGHCPNVSTLATQAVIYWQVLNVALHLCLSADVEPFSDQSKSDCFADWGQDFAWDVM